MERCQAVELAIANSDDIEAEQAYQELLLFVGDRQLKHSFNSERFQAVQEAFASVKIRLEQVRRKRDAEELADVRKREARDKVEKRQSRVAVTPGRQRENSVKGFTESELQKILRILKGQGYSEEDALLTIYSMLNYDDTRAELRRYVDGLDD